jgi:hypothetical protein
MYTRVLFLCVEDRAAVPWTGVSAGLISGRRVAVVCSTNERGFSIGDGAVLVAGHASVKPAGSSVDGSTRKLNDAAASWMREKCCVISGEEKRW